MPMQFTDEERQAAARFLSSSGIVGADGQIDASIMLGFLISIIRFAAFDFPVYVPFRLAVARYEAYEQLMSEAAAASDPVGLYFSRSADTDLAPVDPPPGVAGTQLGTRAFPPRPNFLDGPPLPVCLVDPTTLFCQTHQGVHVAEHAEIFDILSAGVRA